MNYNEKKDVQLNEIHQTKANFDSPPEKPFERIYQDTASKEIFLQIKYLEYIFYLSIFITIFFYIFQKIKDCIFNENIQFIINIIIILSIFCYFLKRIKNNIEKYVNMHKSLVLQDDKNLLSDALQNSQEKLPQKEKIEVKRKIEESSFIKFKKISITTEAVKPPGIFCSLMETITKHNITFDILWLIEKKDIMKNFLLNSRNSIFTWHQQEWNVNIIHNIQGCFKFQTIPIYKLSNPIEINFQYCLAKVFGDSKIFIEPLNQEIQKNNIIPDNISLPFCPYSYLLEDIISFIGFRVDLKKDEKNLILQVYWNIQEQFLELEKGYPSKYYGTQNILEICQSSNPYQFWEYTSPFYFFDIPKECDWIYQLDKFKKYFNKKCLKIFVPIYRSSIERAKAIFIKKHWEIHYRSSLKYIWTLCYHCSNLFQIPIENRDEKIKCPSCYNKLQLIVENHSQIQDFRIHQEILSEEIFSEKIFSEEIFFQYNKNYMNFNNFCKKIISTKNLSYILEIYNRIVELHTRQLNPDEIIKFYKSFLKKWNEIFHIEYTISEIYSWKTYLKQKKYAIANIISAWENITSSDIKDKVNEWFKEMNFSFFPSEKYTKETGYLISKDKESLKKMEEQGMITIREVNDAQFYSIDSRGCKLFDEVFIPCTLRYFPECNQPSQENIDFDIPSVNLNMNQEKKIEKIYERYKEQSRKQEEHDQKRLDFLCSQLENMKKDLKNFQIIDHYFWFSMMQSLLNLYLSKIDIDYDLLYEELENYKNQTILEKKYFKKGRDILREYAHEDSAKSLLEAIKNFLN